MSNNSKDRDLVEFVRKDFTRAKGTLTKRQKWGLGAALGVTLVTGAVLGGAIQDSIINQNNILIPHKGAAAFLLEQGMPRELFKQNAQTLSAQFVDQIADLANQQNTLRFNLCTDTRPEAVSLRRKLDDIALVDAVTERTMRSYVRDVIGPDTILGRSGLLSKEYILGGSAKDPVCVTDSSLPYATWAFFSTATAVDVNASLANREELLAQVKAHNSEPVSYIDAAKQKVSGAVDNVTGAYHKAERVVKKVSRIAHAAMD